MRIAPLRFLTAYCSLCEQPGTKSFVAAGFFSRLSHGHALSGLLSGSWGPAAARAGAGQPEAAR